MKFTLFTMCEIYDPAQDQVVVLDKVKRYGWEGLTYPGGHVELGESLLGSVCREVREETALTIHRPQYVGAVHWITEAAQDHWISLLYRATEFEGTLCPENREGRLQWMKRDELMQKSSLFSDSMGDILSIYRGEYREILFFYEQAAENSFRLLRSERQ